MERFKLHIEAESRIRWKVYVRFGGEFSETDHSNMARRWLLSLQDELLQWIESGRKQMRAMSLQEQAAEIVHGAKQTKGRL